MAMLGMCSRGVASSSMRLLQRSAVSTVANHAWGAELKSRAALVLLSAVSRSTCLCCQIATPPRPAFMAQSVRVTFLIGMLMPVPAHLLLTALAILAAQYLQGATSSVQGAWDRRLVVLSLAAATTSALLSAGPSKLPLFLGWLTPPDAVLGYVAASAGACGRLAVFIVASAFAIDFALLVLALSCRLASGPVRQLALWYPTWGDEGGPPVGHTQTADDSTVSELPTGLTGQSVTKRDNEGSAEAASAEAEALKCEARLGRTGLDHDAQ